MPILISTVEADKLGPRIEHWILNNGLNASVAYGSEHCDIVVQNQSGDITDQIYNKLKNQYPFENIKLLALDSYYVIITESLIQEFLRQAGMVNVSELREGKKY